MKNIAMSLHRFVELHITEANSRGNTLRAVFVNKLQLILLARFQAKA
ncbi:MAG: hypothetical protein R3Y11_07475 [Pseudomonadota bacterium]